MLDWHEVRRTQLAGRLPISDKGVEFLLQNFLISSRNELERPVVTHGLSAAEPNSPEAARSDLADDFIAVEDIAGLEVLRH
jgi:hypothetical protein